MRRSFTVASIAVHSVVIAAALLAQVVADGALPTPHRPIMFDSSQFMPVDIQLPEPRALPSARTSETVSASAAPIVAPTGVADETGHEDDSAPTSAGLISGAEGGAPSDIEGVGLNPVLPPPPPTAPAQMAPLRLHSGMKAPVKIADVAPVYPGIARNARIEGVVILEAVLNAQGRVQSVRVLRSVEMLDRAAVDAVEQWRFTPALVNGQAVPVIMTVTVNFTLQ